MTTTITVVPAPSLCAAGPYVSARHTAPCDLDLAGTEAGGVNPTLFNALRGDAVRLVGRYPDPRPLAAALAKCHGVTADRVLVTAGADEALDRACRAFLAPGRNALLTDPTFEMLPRYVALTGAEARTVPWPDGSLPVNALLGVADAATSLVAIVTPNNPTGTVAAADDVCRIHDALPSAVIVVDLAYVEFADTDPTTALMRMPRVLVVRTLSKAWGMPGIRVGYAMGDPALLGWMRRAAGPYPVSALSLALAITALEAAGPARDATVATVRRRRDTLGSRIAALRAPSPAAQGNFVCVVGPRARWLHDGLAGLGIATRLLVASDTTRTRITVPLDDADSVRLNAAIDCVLSPEAVLFDLDGVLADVSGSYHEAIRQTAATFGVPVTARDIDARKAAGNANDDWQVTAELINAGGLAVPLAVVTARFEELYQGTSERPGLRENERLIVTRNWLVALAGRLPLAIVTGRPHADAEWFLRRFGVRDLFAVVIAREDGPLKPDPFPVRAALDRLGVSRAWFLGDTIDDIASARAAGVVPLGVIAPGAADPPARCETLLRAGAARVLNNPTELDQCLT